MSDDWIVNVRSVICTISCVDELLENFFNVWFEQLSMTKAYFSVSVHCLMHLIGCHRLRNKVCIVY